MTLSSAAHPLAEASGFPSEKPTPVSRIVNVAQVKHRSPLRYPGGKTWLVPRIRSCARCGNLDLCRDEG